MTTRQRRRPVQAPKARTGKKARTTPRRAMVIVAGAAWIIAALVTILAVTRGGGGEPAQPPPQGLPNTPDYHSLNLSANDPRVILLGTHQGLYRSTDGGRSWHFAAIGGQDAMNLARSGDAALWAAGHNVLARSTDGGRSWTDVRPSGLPSLDLHGFTTDPRRPTTLFAAVAGRGLYLSTDNARTFRRASDIGGSVMALAITPRGELFAGDMQRGLLASPDGGRTWREALNAQIMGLAVNPADPDRILATGTGVFLSTDGGRRWREQLEVPDGAGPVAWAPSDPDVAYVIGFNRLMYRSADRGETWRVVR